MNERKKDKLIRIIKRIPRPFIYIFISVLVLYFSFASFMIFSYDDWGKSGTLGDTFGIINALFTSVGTAGLIYTLYLQNKTFEVGIKPLLELVPEGEKEGSYKINVTNLGNGTAINIEVLPSVIALSDLEKYKPFQFRLVEDERFNLRTGGSKVIKMGVFGLNQEELDPMFLALLEKKYSNTPVKFYVEYQDVDFKKFKQQFELGLSDGSIKMAEL